MKKIKEEKLMTYGLKKELKKEKQKSKNLRKEINDLIKSQKKL